MYLAQIAKERASRPHIYMNMNTNMSMNMNFESDQQPFTKQHKKREQKIQKNQKQSQLFGQVGLSTLMDISLSTIRVKPQKKGHFKIDNLRNSQAFPPPDSIKAEVEEMRRKLALINERQLKTKSQLLPQKCKGIEDQEDQFLKQLSAEIKKNKISRAIRILIKLQGRRFFDELYLYDVLIKRDQRRKSSLMRSAFEDWVAMVSEKGERKCIMDAIRDRIIQKRRCRNMGQIKTG